MQSGPAATQRRPIPTCMHGACNAAVLDPSAIVPTPSSTPSAPMHGACNAAALKKSTLPHPNYAPHYRPTPAAARMHALMCNNTPSHAMAVHACASMEQCRRAV
mmetsp:Transcript_3957/g.11256  ORF Transcript_3957/g.11256 Transcript_3957/m.11256 type:complete len:104 (-) Transcript_3957:201-512(-)